MDHRQGESSGQLLREQSWTVLAGARDYCVHELIEEQVARTPDRVAIVSGEASLTYHELDAQASALAGHLRAAGVGPEVLVGVYLDRSPAMVVTILGVLKAGGAYLPLDPDLPDERIAFMLADAAAPVVVTESRLTGRLPARGVRIVNIDAWDRSVRSPELAQGSGGRPAPHNLMYVLYTSGSTGRPKGVQVEHRQTVNAFRPLVEKLGLTSEDVVLAVSSLSFDISVIELLAPLTLGASVHLVPRAIGKDGRTLAALIAGLRVTYAQATPSTWEMLIAAGWMGNPGLIIVTGGEQLTSSLASALLARGRSLWNAYGPTEATIWATVEKITSPEGPLPIGRPIANTEIYILDERNQKVPPGLRGEIYIGGDGVARGYLGRPQLTAERFIPNPFGPGRLYRTGDAARWLPDGRIEFVGRLDFQVKIRGNRVELGEVEAALAGHPGVGACVVLAREDMPGEKRLVAYVVTSSDRALPTGDLRKFLKDRLPDYMVPAAFVLLDRLPLTPSGKVDRGALPSPDSRREAESGYVAPRTLLEAQLAHIWEEVLDIHPVGMADNFFDLGGDSLMVVELFAEIEKQLGKQIAMVSLVQAPTIELLARCIEADGWRTYWSSLVPIQPSGSKPIFYCVHEVEGNVFYYRDLAVSLGPDQPFYGLQAQGLDGKAELHRRIEDMAAHYVQEVVSLQPQGPYYLGGSSLGGLVAFEMARQLDRQGRKVGLVALFDTDSPGFLKLLRIPPEGRSARHMEMLKGRSLAGGARYILGRARARYDTWLRPGLVMGRLRRHVDEARARLYPRFGRPLPLALRELRLREAAMAATTMYEPEPYDGKVVFFRAEGQPDYRYHDPCLDPASIIAAGFFSKTTDPAVIEQYSRLGWGRLAAGGLEIRDVCGGHGAMMRGNYAQSLAEDLRRCLDQAYMENSAL
jgi:amino acid adenylation domain-containing protein